MSKFEVIDPRPQAVRINLSDWCSRPTYRLGRKLKASDLRYSAHGTRISQRSAYSLIDDVCNVGCERTIVLRCNDQHTNTYRVKNTMEALLKICDLAIAKKATRNRRDGEKPMTAYTVEVY